MPLPETKQKNSPAWMTKLLLESTFPGAHVAFKPDDGSEHIDYKGQMAQLAAAGKRDENAGRYS